MIFFTLQALNEQLDSGKALAKGVQSSSGITRRRQWRKSDVKRFSHDTVVEDEVYIGRGSGRVKRSA